MLFRSDHTLSFYVSHGYVAINTFLINSEVNDFFKKYSYFTIIKILAKKFPKEDTMDNTTYAKKILYYYFVNLYSTIQKYPRSQSPFIVYRGSTKHYLSEENTHKYYINSFLSTSYKQEISNRFGQIHYVFYVHPLCNYINASKLSTNKSEHEILFSPYHRYTFTQKVGDTYYYILVPSELTIPTTFEEYMPWAATHHTIQGGNGNNNPKIKNLNMTRSSNRLNRSNTTRKNMNNNPLPIATNNTKTNANDPTVNSKDTGFSERMAMEIKSFGGTPLTEEEKRINEELIAFGTK